jgi:hypothetical protein
MAVIAVYWQVLMLIWPKIKIMLTAEPLYRENLDKIR